MHLDDVKCSSIMNCSIGRVGALIKEFETPFDWGALNCPRTYRGDRRIGYGVSGF